VSQPVFADRHVGPRTDDVARMLERVGFSSLDDLMAAAVPPTIASRTLGLPEPLHASCVGTPISTGRPSP
jgi:glycine dehydrogenase